MAIMIYDESLTSLMYELYTPYHLRQVHFLVLAVTLVEFGQTWIEGEKQDALKTYGIASIPHKRHYNSNRCASHLVTTLVGPVSLDNEIKKCTAEMMWSTSYYS
ncbi:hypothetical protein QTP88_016449 [Uroleucon formosanum]